MLSTADVAAFRADLAELTGLAAREVAAVTRGVDTPQEMRDLLSELLPGLVTLYGAAAASLAADWYEAVRAVEGVRGFFTAIPALLPDVARTDALAGWSVAKAFAGVAPGELAVLDRPAVVVKVSGGLQRIVADAARETIQTSSLADPAADGWQRVGSGECDWCNVLISRGAVYSEATVRFASHDHCKCSAVPSFGGVPVTVKPYTPSPRKSRTDYERALKWMKENGY